MLKKLETIEADNSHAVWPEMKIHRNIDRFQEQGGQRGLEADGGGGEEQGIPSGA